MSAVILGLIGYSAVQTKPNTSPDAPNKKIRRIIAEQKKGLGDITESQNLVRVTKAVYISPARERVPLKGTSTAGILKHVCIPYHRHVNNVTKSND